MIKVMIADDQELIRESLKIVLSTHVDIDVVDTASDGFEVLKFLNLNKINIPVIVISAYSDKNSKLQAFKLGANDYMVKPIDPEELEARIWVQLKNLSTFIEKVNKNIFECLSFISSL